NHPSWPKSLKTDKIILIKLFPVLRLAPLAAQFLLTGCAAAACRLGSRQAEESGKWLILRSFSAFPGGRSDGNNHEFSVRNRPFRPDSVIPEEGWSGMVFAYRMKRYCIRVADRTPRSAFALDINASSRREGDWPDWNSPWLKAS